MSGKLTTLDQLATIPGWDEILPALEDQGLVIDENDVFVVPDLQYALEDAAEKLQDGEFDRESLYPIFDLNRIAADTLDFQNRMDRILGYDTEVEPGVIGVTYRDLRRLYRGGQGYGATAGVSFEDAATDVLQDVADDFFTFVDDGVESEDESSSDSDGSDEEAAGDEGSDSDDEVVQPMLNLRITDPAPTGAMPTLPTVGLPLPTVAPVTVPPLPPGFALPMAPMPPAPTATKARGRKPKVPQPPPMALPMQTDLAALNQAREGLAQIQEINPDAYFQRKMEVATAPRLNILPAPLALPKPSPTTQGAAPTVPLQLPQVQLPQVQPTFTIPTVTLPTATGPTPGLTVEIPRFVTKMDAVAAPVSGVAVAVARQTAAAPISVQQAALEIAKQIDPLKIHAGRVSRDDKSYYTTEELKEFARAMGLRMSGSKAEVIDRIKAVMRQAGVNV